MKEGYLLKRKTEHGVVSPQELEKINQYTRREFQAQELKRARPTLTTKI